MRSLFPLFETEHYFLESNLCFPLFETEHYFLESNLCFPLFETEDYLLLLWPLSHSLTRILYGISLPPKEMLSANHFAILTIFDFAVILELA
jgi:hypothetical protein